MDAEAISWAQSQFVHAGECQAVETYNLTLRFHDLTLLVFSAWRVHRGSDLVPSSTVRPEELRELLMPMLKAGRVKSVFVKGPYHDLVLVFEEGAVLETFGDASAHENWHIARLDSLDLLIAGPGESWSRFGGVSPKPRDGT